MVEVNVEHLREWIGKTEQKSDVITPGLVERLRATLGDTACATPDALPLAIHWCLAPPAVPPSEIGSDGHPARGGFLPPVPLPCRMWAGGALEFHQPLVAGDTVTHRSRIAGVTEKSGRTGHLVFVTVEHQISTNDSLAVSERQDIVYREAQAAAGSKPAAPTQTRKAAHQQTIQATTTLLFRYSALTFNGHRIHYDRDYARDIEGYPGLVVHGPLQATMLVNFAARLKDGRTPTRFSYRGLSPLFDGPDFTLNAIIRDATVELWCADHNGTTTMEATALFAA